MKEELTIISNDELVETAMQIILLAGDGRNHMTSALKKAKEGNFEEAEELVAASRECIRQAHSAQTSLISKEASGKVRIQPTLIFNHAQDTLMTIITEINLSIEMIDILKMIQSLQLG